MFEVACQPVVCLLVGTGGGGGAGYCGDCMSSGIGVKRLAPKGGPTLDPMAGPLDGGVGGKLELDEEDAGSRLVPKEKDGGRIGLGGGLCCHCRLH